MTRLTKLSIGLLLSLACAKHETPVVKRIPAKPRQKNVAPALQKSAEPSEIAVGSTMPAYSAQSLDGKEFNLASQKGSVVLLNLWATWCEPCRFEIPELERMHGQYAPRGLKVIGVSLDDTGVDSVKSFVTEHKMTYPIVIDPEGRIANIFQTSIIPTTVLIDKSGKIVWKEYGALSADDKSLQKALDSALAAKT